MADIAEVLWNDFLVHNPANPAWANRDRFVLSNGHGSMLLYALLHLSGYDLPLEEIKRFRQLHSMTPGHPEYGYAPGVETTTGPLSQGLANAVGMAMAERTLAAQFNRDGHGLIDHFTDVFAGDGCLMEGISHEVCSLAGTQGLGKLIVFYDDNGISIDGKVEGWFTDDTPGRFAAYGRHVIPRVDGHDSASVKKAIEEARADTARPSLICCQTIIGWGSPNKQGKDDCHGAALGEYVHYITPQFSQTDINFQRVPTVDTSNPFVARDIPTPDESFVVIRFRDPTKFRTDFPYLLSMINGSFMSRRNSIVIPGGKAGLAMEIIFAPIVDEMMNQRRATLKVAWGGEDRSQRRQ
jgi:transketolase